jgi:hypothetical protein
VADDGIHHFPPFPFSVITENWSRSHYSSRSHCAVDKPAATPIAGAAAIRSPRRAGSDTLAHHTPQGRNASMFLTEPVNPHRTRQTDPQLLRERQPRRQFR